MRFVIFGAGAVGGVIGGRLAEHGHDVVLLARGDHLDALRAGGLRLVTGDHTVTLDLPVAGHPGEIAWRAGDVVVLAVKSQHTVAALGALGEHAPSGIPVVCAQNGVQNERMVLRRFANVHALCVWCPATHLEPGVVEAGWGPVTGVLDLGRYPAGTDEVDGAVAAALSSSTFLSVPRPDIMAWKHHKLLLNLGNAIQALCGLDPEARDLYRRVRDEGRSVLRSAGVPVIDDELERERRRAMGDNALGRRLGGGSSWQSLSRGAGSIETDYLNGEIVLQGRLHGVPAPLNLLLQDRTNAAARAGAAPGSMTVAELTALFDRAEAGASS